MREFDEFLILDDCGFCLLTPLTRRVRLFLDLVELLFLPLEVLPVHALDLRVLLACRVNEVLLYVGHVAREGSRLHLQPSDGIGVLLVSLIDQTVHFRDVAVVRLRCPERILQQICLRRIEDHLRADALVVLLTAGGAAHVVEISGDIPRLLVIFVGNGGDARLLAQRAEHHAVHEVGLPTFLRDGHDAVDVSSVRIRHLVNGLKFVRRNHWDKLILLKNARDICAIRQNPAIDWVGELFGNPCLVNDHLFGFLVVSGGNGEPLANEIFRDLLVSLALKAHAQRSVHEHPIFTVRVQKLSSALVVARLPVSADGASFQRPALLCPLHVYRTSVGVFLRHEKREAQHHFAWPVIGESSRNEPDILDHAAIQEVDDFTALEHVSRQPVRRPGHDAVVFSRFDGADHRPEFLTHARVFR